MNEEQALKYYQPLLPKGYSLSHLLAEGGFAQTFLALRTNQSACVLKVLSMQRVEDWKSVELFEREAKILKHLDHPNIPAFYDAFSAECDNKSYFFLVQEYLEAQTLEEKITQGKRFNEVEALGIAQQIIDVLIYLHDFSPPIIHRDIKPSNIMLNPQNKAWLIDFGAVRDTVLRQGERGSTVVGTFGYMPLEQFEGRSQAASDIYALGMSLIFVLSGKEPTYMNKKGLKTDFRPYINSSPALAKILERMIEPDLQKRYRSAEEVKQDLSKLNHPKTSLKYILHSLSSSLKNNHYSRVKLFQSIAATALIIIAGFWLMQRNQHSKSIQATQVPTSHTESIKAETDFPNPWQITANEAPKDVSAQAWAKSALWQTTYTRIYRLKNNEMTYWDLKDILGSESKSIGQLLGNDQAIYLVSDSNKPAIAYLDHKTWLTLELPESIKITAAAVLNQDLLIAQSNKLWRYRQEQKSWKLWAETPKATYNQEIHALVASSNPETVWISANSQIWQLNEQQLHSIWKSTSNVEHLLLSDDRHLWMGTSKGLFAFNPEENSVTPHLAYENIKSLSLDQDQQLWVGTQKNGLFYYDTQNKWQNQSWTHGLPRNRVQSVLVDPQNQIWLALDNEKVHQAKKADLLKNWQQRVQIAAIPHKTYANACEAVKTELANGEVQDHIAREDYDGRIHAFVRGEQVCPLGNDYRASDGQIYSSTYKGIVQKKGAQTNIGKPSHKYAHISSLYLDSQKRLWANGYAFGLAFYHRGKWNKVAGKEIGLVKFYETPEGEILLGKNSGGKERLQSYKDGHLNPIALGDKTYMTIYQMQSQSPENTLIASSEGLWQGQPNHWQLLTKEHGLPFERIQHMTVQDHRAWMIGERGLAWLDLESPKGSPTGDNTAQNIGWLNTRTGLFSDQLDEIASDGHNTLWLINDRQQVAIYQVSDLEARHATLLKKTQRKPDS